MTPEQKAAIDQARARVAAIKAAKARLGQSQQPAQPSPEALERAARADQAALHRMGFEASPQGQALSVVDTAPQVGFQAVRSAETPLVGGWADELAGIANLLTGGSYSEGRERFNAMVDAFERENPDGASRARVLGNVEGAIAAVGPAAAAKAFKAGGVIYNTAKGAAQGATAGALEGAVSGAGEAEPGERLEAAKSGAATGALFGAGAGAAFNLGAAAISKSAKAILNKSAERPTVENLRAAKTAAYRAIDKAGEAFEPSDVRGAFDKFKAALDDADFVEGMGGKTDQWLKRFERLASRDTPTTISRLDKMRQNLYKAYSAAPDEVELLDAVSVIDDLIESKAASSELMSAARLANSRYKKAELLDNAFKKAADQTASTGSGGNILNKYRQAVTSIVNNPKKAKFFSAQEIEAMNHFIHGDMTENALRRVGKLAPGGNGLMQALNLAAVSVNPAALVGSAAAQGAKGMADRSVATKAEALQTLMATGKPAPRPSVSIPGAGAVGAGLIAGN